TAKDANACTVTQPATITVPPQIVLTATPTDPNCFGQTGSITASATGGTGAITYAIDGVTFQVSGTFSGLAAGTYTITAKDANACTVTQPATITVPPQIVLTATPTDPSCIGRNASITASATCG